MLTNEEVNHVALLARLYIDDSEREVYKKQLYDILSEIKKIEEVDIGDDTDIMISPCNNTNGYSNDSIGPMLSNKEIFKNVKHSNGDYIVVPKALND